MSEIRVDTISEKTSGSGTTVSNLKNPNQPFRNKIINGDFQVFQRATAATTAAQNTYNTTDRWKFQVSNDGAFTTEKETLSLADQATTGSATAFEIKCTSTDSSIGSGQYALISQDIEAQFLQDLLYGTSSAKDITVSFWCKSNLTGTFSLFLIKMDNTAYYIPTEFSLSSADTWEKKTITITPTQGSTSFITGSAAIINNDNGHGIQIGIALAAGSNLQGTNNTWTTSSAYTTSNQVNFLSSTDNNFYLTNVQLEVGSTATDFEHLPFDVQLRRCQRYFQSYIDPPLRGAVNATQNMGRLGMVLPVTMRAAGTASLGTHNVYDGSNVTSIASTTVAYVTDKQMEFDVALAAASVVVGRPGMVYITGGTTTTTLDAEL